MSEPAPVPAAVVPARFPEHLATVRALFTEYAESLGFSLCFQGFDAELAGLPGAYAEPAGTVLLAGDGAAPAGVVALRPLGDGYCEMKRLYVRPQYRGRGLGRSLVRSILAIGRDRGYRIMRLDTVDQMVGAQALYRAFGFEPTEPYNHSPLATIRHFKLSFDGTS